MTGDLGGYSCAMLAALLLQTSLTVSPLCLQQDPPDCRALRAMWVAPVAGRGAPITDEDRARAERAVARLRAGDGFERVLRDVDPTIDAGFDGVLGTFMQGILAPPVDRFLFDAEVGEISEPIESSLGLQIVQRIEKDAAVRSIAITQAGADGRARAERLLSQLRAGADFAELARQHSDDLQSKPRGGAFAIFERGPQDKLLKAVAFQLRIGEISEPIESPLGFHLIKRVPISELDPSLAEVNLARVRGILIAYQGARGASPELARQRDVALAFANELVGRINSGEDMAELARHHDDDSGGRERAGDLGWMRRGSPQIPRYLDKVFLEPVGRCIGPLPSTAGWLIARRER